MDLQKALKHLTPTERQLLDQLLSGEALWQPHPENRPQVQAYTCEADILYYGGAAGGGKSDLLLGLALTAHEKSIIFRREFPQLAELIDRSQALLEDTPAKYNQTRARWVGIPGGKVLEFGAVQYEKDKEKYKGRPHDLIGFDEIPDFTETQFRFLMGWNRTTTPGQRCRVVAAGNPPTHAQGEWVIRFWAPWLSRSYRNPAKPGELRWFASLGGRDTEVASGEPFEYDGEVIVPLSRSFIPARLADNPYLRNSNYYAVLQGLPEPLRSQLLWGIFSVSTASQPNQVIPTEWILAAQERWTLAVSSGLVPDVELLEMEGSAEGLSITAMGVDPARGGKDNMEIARRSGDFYYPLLTYPGEVVPDGRVAAAYVVEALGDSFDAIIGVDVIGVGGSTFDMLMLDTTRAEEGDDGAPSGDGARARAASASPADLDVFLEAEHGGLAIEPVNNAAATRSTTSNGLLGFANVRAESYWRLREALDPSEDSQLMLPPGDELVADLSAPVWSLTPRGIMIEPKKSIRKRLGRSPGKGDAVVLANFVAEELGVFFH